MHPLDIHWVLAFGSVALVSGASLTGMLALSINPGRLARVIPVLVGVAAGALLGTAFGHLLPESVERLGSGRLLSVLLVASFASFFILDKVIGACLRETEDSEGHDHGLHPATHAAGVKTMRSRPVIVGVLFGAATHSFIDGMAIATGYITGTQLGLITTFAILLHETPHHIGDVSILIHHGTSIRRSVALNLMVGSTSAIGALLVLLLGGRFTAITDVLLPFTTANFIYIASVNLIPELQRERGIRESITQAAALVFGCLLMLAVAYFIRG
jgi:zinc and cadmium transporter